MLLEGDVQVVGGGTAARRLGPSAKAVEEHVGEHLLEGGDLGVREPAAVHGVRDRHQLWGVGARERKQATLLGWPEPTAQRWIGLVRGPVLGAVAGEDGCEAVGFLLVGVVLVECEAPRTAPRTRRR